VSELNSQDELDPEQPETAVGQDQQVAGGDLPVAQDSSAEGDLTPAEDSFTEEAPAAAAAPVEAPPPKKPAAKSAAAKKAPEEAASAPEAGEDGQGVRQIGVPGMDWYIIHTYSGFENKVKESLRSRAEAFGFGERIGEILIPTEDVVEMRSGKKVTSKRMLYPGYVLVQLLMDDELWHVVKNTPRVTGFVGGGQVPTPLTADEVNQTLYRQKTSAEKPRPKMTFEKNDRVKIIDGPFSNFSGSVEEVNEDRNTLKVMVTIFGRGTPVELEYIQVEKEGG
jgi:transcriptional antiterminator NusG